MTDPVTVGVVAMSEVVKLLLMARFAAIKNGMTPEEFNNLAASVNAAFDANDPSKLPER